MKKGIDHVQTRKIVQLGTLLVVFIMISPAVADLAGLYQYRQDSQNSRVRAKTASVQNGAFTVTDNSEFTGAGFTTGEGSPDDPYVFDGTAYGTIEAGGTAGINISDTDAYFRIENVMINGSTNTVTGGVHLENVTNGLFINVTVTNSTYGFYLESCSYNSLTGNNATENTIRGFSLSSSSNYNTLTSNNAGGSNYGFFLWSSSNNILTGNTATGNQEGFLLLNSSSSTLTSNNASGNTGDGFFLWGSEYNNLTGNTATGNQEGFYLASSSINNTLTGNTASGNTGGGFYLWSSSNNNTLTGNTASGNTGDGFSLSSSDYNNLTGNDATGNSNGFYLLSSSNNTFSENNASGNTNDGFILWSSNNNTLTGNNASGNDRGIFLESSNSNTLTGNNASGNDRGIFLESSNSNTLTGNNASENTGDVVSSIGFSLSSSSNNTLTGNIASENTGGGFSLSSSSNYNTLTSNNAGGNTNYGFRLESSSNHNTLTSNNARRNLLGGFSLSSSSNNTLTGNIASENPSGGFHLQSSSNYNTLIGNIASENPTGDGFHLQSSSNYNTLIGNTASGNSQMGFYITGENTLTSNTASGNSQIGFYITGNNNMLIGNNAMESITGFYIFMNGNTLIGNTAYNNTGHGMFLLSSSNNLIYCNFFIDNQDGAPQGYDDGLDNDWTNSTHGNYWSDYIGVDAGNDGIGETNYTLSGNTPSANDTRPIVFAFLKNISTLQLIGPENQVFEEGTTGIFAITWFPSTNIPVNTTYILYKDNVPVGTGNWISGTTVQMDVNLTGLTLGMYNYTLAISDYSNKTMVNNVLLTVEETVDPMIDYGGMAEITFEAGSAGNEINVTATDLHPATYTVYLNGTAATPVSWTSDTPFQISLDSLTLGSYNVTLTVQDTSGNRETLTVTVIVEDTVAPVIDYAGLTEISFEAGSTGNNLIINATDLYNSTYTVYLNGTAATPVSWTSDTPFQISLDNLALGVHNVTLTVQDTSGNRDTLTVTVIVEDTVAPVITYTGSDMITFEEGSIGHVIHITATDLYPGNFTLYQNGTGAGTYNWNSETTITVNLDDLSLSTGTYSFTLVVRDTSGNEATLIMITVTVTAKLTTTTTTTTITSTSSSSTPTTTTTPSPGWTLPLVLVSLACTACILSWRRSRWKK